MGGGRISGFRSPVSCVLELAQYHRDRPRTTDDHFVARTSTRRPAADVLDDLFRQAVRQLADYCVEPIDPRTPTMVSPVTASEPRLRATADRLGARLLTGLAALPELQLVERATPVVLAALKSQSALRYDQTRAPGVGKLAPARLGVLSQLERAASGELQMLIKLVRLETGEILSVSLLHIDERLVPLSSLARARAASRP